MATKQAARQHDRPSKRSRSAGSSTRRGSSRAKSGSRSTSKRAPARRSASTPWLGSALRQSFDGHGHDIAGLVAIVAGVVIGLAVYADVAGPLGRGVATGTGAVAGLLSWLVPPALVALGIVVIRGRRPEAEPVAIVRPVLGSILVVVGACGLLDLVRGRPELGDRLSTMVRAGGAVGIVAGGGLAGLVGPWAAGLVLVVLCLIGVMLVTRTSMRAAAGHTAAGVRPLTGAVGRFLRPLFEVGAPDPDADIDPAIDLRDGRADDGSMSDPDDGSGGFSVTVAGAEATAEIDPGAGEDHADAAVEDPEPPVATDPAAAAVRSRPAPASSRSTSGRPTARPSGSCRRPSCCSGRRSTRSTARPWKAGAAPSRPRWRTTASRPAWSAWWSARP